MSRKLRSMKPRKVNRGAFEEQKQREDNKMETQRALLYILPIVMLAILAVGIFFGYKFYENSNTDHNSVKPSEAVDADSYSSNPVFYRSVNSANKLTEDYVPDTVEVCGVKMSPEAADPLKRMVDDAKKQGYDLMVVEGYISFKEQNTRYNEKVEKYRKESKSSLVMAEAHVKQTVPPAGESEQQTGLVVNLTVKTDGKFADTPAYTWLVRNSVDYGFILRYPEKENAGGFSYSSHLFRFVGEENALRMRTLDMNFDQYLKYINAH